MSDSRPLPSPFFSSRQRTALGLLAMRLSVALMLLKIHGLPKALHWHEQLAQIEDPFGLGASLTLGLSVAVEVLCPLLIIAGVFTRLASLAVIGLMLVALVLVHPEWTLEQGQFGWLYVILFGALALTGPGEWALRPGRG